VGVPKPLKYKGFINSVDERRFKWFPRKLMRTSQTTAFMATTAAAVAFAYASATTTRAFAMWSSPVVKHSNKRFTRRPDEVVN
jgi:hypothetical protein